MPLQHSQLDPDRPGFALLDENGVPHSWVLAQLREFVRFDRDLRSGAVTTTTLVLPGGYNFFAALFNADPNCIYQFSTFDPATNSTTVRGAPIPNRLLDELDPPPPVADPTPSEPQFTPQRVRTIERMLWGSAEREARYLERRDAVQDRRTEDRKRKRAEHRAADEARASKTPTLAATSTSTGILAVGTSSGSSGGTSILSAAAPRGAGSSGAAAGSRASGSSTTGAVRREGSPMEQDKDAEGVEDTELIPYSDSEDVGKEKPGKGKEKDQ
ncbi:hypothetical protein V8D89_015373 [Ganoderma adspersum]